VSLGLPVERVHAGAELVSGPALADLAAAYERFGFHAAYVTDHPAPDDRWLAGGGHHSLEPTVALAVAAAATRRLLVHTNVYVLGYRNPFLAAKALASLDVVSDGRLVIGVAAGYLRPEFEALGGDFDDRGRRLDEVLELLPRIWSEHSVAASGEGFRATAVTALPHPVQRPHPPIWVGGNSLAAMRRAVRFGQGWSPLPTPGGLARAVRTADIGDLGALAARMRRMHELSEEAGRTAVPTTCFVPFSLPDYLSDPVGGLGRLCDEVGELSDLGVDWISAMVPGATRNEVIDHAGALAAALGLG
jgi:probable F420-dependent oxidoreductase